MMFSVDDAQVAGGVGGGYSPSLLLANKDDVLRFVRGGGAIHLRCSLQTKMMFLCG